eukprot:SAG31_NODE_4010_length_3667_cov_2.004484_3_plen_101_part_00
MLIKSFAVLADVVLQSYLSEAAQFYQDIVAREPQSRHEAESSATKSSNIISRAISIMETACGFDSGNWALRGYNAKHRKIAKVPFTDSESLPLVKNLAHE